MPFIFNFKKLSAKEADEYLYCIPTLVHYLVKYERFPGVSYIQIHQSTLTQSGWLNVLIGQWRVLVGYVDFYCLGNKLCQQTNGCIWAKNGHRRRQEEKELKSGTVSSVSCSILCLYSLKEYMVSVQVKYMELWTSRDEVLSRPVAFFLHEWKFFFMFLCCQWCCVWMLNILKISQM